MAKTEPVTGYRIKDRVVYEGVDPVSGDRFHYRVQEGEVRIPKNEREEQALEHLVVQELADRTKLDTKREQDSAKAGGSVKGGLKTAPAATGEDEPKAQPSTGIMQTERDSDSGEPVPKVPKAEGD